MEIELGKIEIKTVAAPESRKVKKDNKVRELY